MEKLHPGARWVFRLRGYLSMIFLSIFLGVFFLGAMGILAGFSGVFTGILILIILIVVVAEIYARLAYNNWGYSFEKDQLKIEKGIIFKTYKSIPYERIQNVDVTRGILARMIGFSTLDIQTAGYSFAGRGAYRGGSEGHIPAVSIKDAEHIREWIIKRISHSKSGV